MANLYLGPGSDAGQEQFPDPGRAEQRIGYAGAARNRSRRSPAAVGFGAHTANDTPVTVPCRVG